MAREDEQNTPSQPPAAQAPAAPQQAAPAPAQSDNVSLRIVSPPFLDYFEAEGFRVGREASSVPQNAVEKITSAAAAQGIVIETINPED